MNFFRSLTVPAQGLGLRPLSTSAPCLAEKYFKITKYARPIDQTIYKAGDPLPKRSIPAQLQEYPEYKYETMFFKRQNRGLYGGLQRKRSKTCSESGNKNLRVHLPNIQKTKLWSETLNKRIATRASTSVLRTITKEGGLDNYLLKDKPAREKTMGLKGWKLKYEILKQKELLQNSEGAPATVHHVSKSGKKITATKQGLLEVLYPFVYRDNYEPVSWEKYLRSHSVLTSEELVEKLEQYGFDFTPITV